MGDCLYSSPILSLHEWSERAAYAFLANVRVAFRHMDKKMFINTYVTYMRPKLEYAAPFWNPHLKNH
ncbi:hypothetical protein SK128_006339, partial [Halocaridina rubra]